MQKILYAITALAVAVMPAKAETAFWFTCDFDSGAGVQTTSFGLYASDGNGFIAFDGEEDLRPIIWIELGTVTHIFFDDVEPRSWVLSFYPKSDSALSYANGQLTQSTSCRFGGR